MQIQIIAVGQKLDGWVYQGVNEYLKRMPPECQVTVVEIPAGKRGKNADIARIVDDEGKKILAAIPAQAHVIAMEVQGATWSTERLSAEMEKWLFSGQNIALLVGGPEGLSNACRNCAQEKWSLSSLTLPHPLVRLLLAEQLYRAWSLLKGHPYHR